jgi:hypothetical protein
MDGIFPETLRGKPRWVHWKYEERGGKRTKVPYTPGTSQRARSTDATTWRTFDEARTLLPESGMDGLGFVLGDGTFGIDLDHMLEGGQPTEEARDILGHFPGAYVEKSPSGEGLHIVGLGTVERGRKKTLASGAIEIYGRARFFTMTGDCLHGFSVAPGEDVTDSREGIEWVFSQYFSANGHRNGEGGPLSTDRPWSVIQLAYAAQPMPPATKLAILQQTVAEWQPTWERTRPMPHDQSLSAYEMALANMMVKARWEPQEVCDTLRHWRLSLGDTTKDSRLDYYQQTIYKAQEIVAKLFPDTPPPTLTPALIEHLTGLKVRRYIQTGKNEALYRVELETGESVTLGNAEKARSQSRWQTLAQEQNGIPFPAVNKNQWQQVMIALGAIVEREFTDESSFMAEFRDRIRHYIHLHAWHAAQPLTYSAVSQGSPFAEDGLFYISIGHLLRWLAHSRIRSTEVQCVQAFAVFGAVRKKVHRREHGKPRVQRWYWGLPENLGMLDSE